MAEINHAYYMKKALRLAAKGLGNTKPNPMVGAVIVDGDRIISEGYHHCYGQCHAEAEAIALAPGKTGGATMYVTLEPCNHFGKTPPCAEAILKAGIKRVVIAALDENPKAKGGAEYLRSKGVEVITGVCEKEAKELNEPFLVSQAKGRPYFLIKAALSLDGFIATKSGDSGQTASGMSGRKSHVLVHRLRAAMQGILVGAKTINLDNPRLTARGVGDVAQPARLILDGSLSVNPKAFVFADKSAKTIVFCRKNAGAKSRIALEKAGALVETLPENADGFLDLNALSERLCNEGITSVIIEGGGKVIGSFLQAGLYDRVSLFYTPYIFGDGVKLADFNGCEKLAEAVKLGKMEVKRVENDAFITFKPL